jgi:hypothetical protein
MNSRWCLWTIHFHKGFCNKPHRLRRSLTGPLFCYPPFECPSTGHSSDGFGDPIKCRFTGYIPGYLPVSLTSAHVLAFPRSGISLFRSKIVILLVESLYAEPIEALKPWPTLLASSPGLILVPDDIQRSGFETAPNLWICQPSPKDS